MKRFKTALITGIAGQDGAYLANFLIKKKYKVIGIDRRSSRNNNFRLKYFGIQNKVILEYCDLTEFYSLERVFKKFSYNFDEVYNLGAQSFVRSSFDTPVSTTDINALGTLRILEIIRNSNKKIKFYQASTSEMFGNINNSLLSERSGFNPQSPYAISKLYAHYITKNYRESYGLFACSGILFNHESPIRAEDFVTKKIVSGFVKILNKEQDCLYLGNLYAKRDWGFAGDYVEAMWLMLQNKKPKDYVIGTGNTYSVKDFINETARYLKIKIKWIGKGLNERAINLDTKKIIIKIDKNNFRPAEVFFLKADNKKARKELKWIPRTKFKSLIKLMIDEELNANKLI
jgi:GDPmannose 4,6-dehydratase